MKKLMTAILILALVLTASMAFAAGSVTVTSLKGTGDAFIVQFAFVANATGAGEIPSTSSSTKWPNKYTGCIYALETNPGSTAPTDDYDITLTNENGVDLLGGQGANRDTANSERVIAKVGTVFACSPTQKAFTLNISGNSVNSATGIVRVIIYEDVDGN